MLDEAGRLAVTTVGAVCILAGAVGWAALGSAWATRQTQPNRDVKPLATAGGVLALACLIGLAILSWTPQLRGWEALLGVASWVVVYVSTVLAKRALHTPN